MECAGPLFLVELPASGPAADRARANSSRSDKACNSTGQQRQSNSAILRDSIGVESWGVSSKPGLSRAHHLEVSLWAERIAKATVMTGWPGLQLLPTRVPRKRSAAQRPCRAYSISPRRRDRVISNRPGRVVAAQELISDLNRCGCCCAELSIHSDGAVEGDHCRTFAPKGSWRR